MIGALALFSWLERLKMKLKLSETGSWTARRFRLNLDRRKLRNFPSSGNDLAAQRTDEQKKNGDPLNGNLCRIIDVIMTKFAIGWSVGNNLRFLQRLRNLLGPKRILTMIEWWISSFEVMFELDVSWRMVTVPFESWQRSSLAAKRERERETS